jgi:hypothetical protein
MITDQPECDECGGECCLPERLEFPLPQKGRRWRDLLMKDAQGVLAGMGLGDGIALGVRTNEHGRTVIRTRCPRRGNCDKLERPIACLMFPTNYFDDDHTDAERDEVREFCALFRRLEAEQ